jgi:hypothetical protein
MKTGKVVFEGAVLGRLTVIKKIGSKPHGKQGSSTTVIWLCKCECGNETLKTTASLRCRAKSCGCLNKELYKTRGLKNRKYFEDYKKEITALNNLNRRCKDEKHIKNYINYIARGIDVCDRWNYGIDKKARLNFIEDMGKCPKEMNCIDRIDNEKGYSKENCRWTTWSVNNKNRRKLKKDNI